MSDFSRWGDKTRTFTQPVDGNTTSWDDVVIPDGEVWVVRGADGAGLDTDGSNVAVVWDRSGTPEVLFLVYGTGSQAVDRSLVGDGIKTLSVRLQNKTT